MKLSMLFTDQYQLVMANGYWQLNKAEEEAVFHLYFRANPFSGNYTVSCGLESVIQFLNKFQFTEKDINYLSQLTKSDGSPLLTKDFLKYLQTLTFVCDIDAVPEGTVVFPNEPLLRIKGPLLQCQLLETPLINLMNFASLVATKAARVCHAAKDKPVVEFGLRRAQGPNGGLTASRAAYIGGCEGTSNTLAGKKYGIPIKGTQAHSWIMSFNDELSAFQGFADLMGDDTILLVDTYNTTQGIQNAIKIGKKLRKKGMSLSAIRLDSGNLDALSKKARQLLDKANLKETKIFASGDLDEYRIEDLQSKRAPIDGWGIGTRLVTAYDQPSLDVIYKLAAIRERSGPWTYKLKVSDHPNKTTTPGIHQVRRYMHQQHLIADIIYDLELGISEKLLPHSDQCVDLLVPIFRKGKLEYQLPDIHDIRRRCLRQVNNFLTSDHRDYHATLEPQLEKLKAEMLPEAIPL